MNASTQKVWLQWAATGCTDLTTNAINDWTNATSIYNNTVALTWTGWAQEAHMSAEDKARMRAAFEEARRRGEAIMAARKAATERAEQLLLLCLSLVQRDQLQKAGWFEVATPTGRRYRIRRGRAGNVFEVDTTGREIKRFCCHPMIDVPDPDTMLTQKLMLETQEHEFLRLANVTHLARTA